MKLTEVNLENSKKLNGEEFLTRVMNLSNFDFTGLILENFDFTGSNLSNTIFNFTDCRKLILNKTNFQDVKISDVKMIASHFFKLTFENLEIDNSDFQGSYFSEMIFKNCKIKNSLFNDCFFDNVNFENCEIYNCNFSGSFFHNVENVEYVYLPHNIFYMVDYDIVVFKSKQMTLKEFKESFQQNFGNIKNISEDISNSIIETKLAHKKFMYENVIDHFEKVKTNRLKGECLNG